MRQNRRFLVRPPLRPEEHVTSLKLHFAVAAPGAARNQS